jgi:ATP phosphoribosyltransferase
LRANHLKVLEDGLIHRSEATLFRSRMAPWGAAERTALGQLVDRIGGASA